MELVQYFVLCCGCRATITMEMFQNEDTTSVIRSLTENFDEVSTCTHYYGVVDMRLCIIGQW